MFCRQRLIYRHLLLNTTGFAKWESVHLLYPALIPGSDFCRANESLSIQGQTALNAVYVITFLCYFPYFLLLWYRVVLQIGNRLLCLTSRI